MDTEEKEYSKKGMREGDPGQINPADVDHTSPAKNVSEIEHLNINQSGSGRDDSYRPAGEYTSEPISQIDEGTKELQQEQQHGNGMNQAVDQQFDKHDTHQPDERDRKNSSDDWDAEGNQSGRHK